MAIDLSGNLESPIIIPFKGYIERHQEIHQAGFGERRSDLYVHLPSKSKQ
jgi:hypothetical protein